ncbi:MAG: Holliday junction branch migration protein RuvA [Rhodospirillaceae bacterium]|jgi:holliday junction DNA helicase RuvA|nr:Holliday junction branch migration protein RuvA [Rhodospirillaceae bacterium]MBT4589468.1 Holliday junction branch migration protein RuvA [Rhodospirillaceae bacterium]MBT5940150.1 Holliday junction branch migration protein RuvA [Rhodospirillaceae bacterium]MBT7266209.1 Holliday junction branch migration protein RuvA [Rhodospirillaceae bacterium]
MIAKLTGLVDQTGEGYVVIDVNGVGYMVFCSNRTLNMLATASGTVSVMIETHVREDHIHLYGFADEAERAWFSLLTTVQGVGAKVCLAILSVLSPDNLVQAIAAQDKAAITRAPGVGPKLATRILTELKDKVGGIALGSTTAALEGEVGGADGTNKFADDAVSALVNLGYGRSEAFQVVHQAAAKHGDGVTVELLIKDGLAELSAHG